MSIRKQILEVTEPYLGTPYSKLDCSKLVQTVFKKFGLELPRTSVEQAKFLYNKKLTTRFSKSDKLADILPKLKVGMLIFWTKTTCKCGRWEEIHHVAIYAGDGNIYESITSEDKVIFRKLWESSNWQIIFVADVTSLLNKTKESDELMIRFREKDGSGKDGKVAAWQLILKSLGYDTGTWPDKDNKPTGIDGSYGEHTKSLTSNMMERFGLSGNGELVDEKTWFVGISAALLSGNINTKELSDALSKIAAGKKAANEVVKALS